MKGQKRKGYPEVTIVAKAKQKDEYKPNEDQIAIAFVDFVKTKYPHYIKSLVKIDNEGKLSWQHGIQKKLQGKRKGASDYFFAMPSTKHYFHVEGYYEESFTFHGLWLELKTHKGIESKEQKEFGELMISHGYQYRCVYSIDEAMTEFEDYIK